MGINLEMCIMEPMMSLYMGIIPLELSVSQITIRAISSTFSSNKVGISFTSSHLPYSITLRTRYSLANQKWRCYQCSKSCIAAILRTWDSLINYRTTQLMILSHRDKGQKSLTGHWSCCEHCRSTHKNLSNYWYRHVLTHWMCSYSCHPFRIWF